jgi:VanZ family protein
MMDAKRRAWWDVPVWVVAQLVITSVPGSAIPVDVHHPFDWVIHTGMYGMLGLLIARAAVLSGWPPRRLVWVFALISLGAALDEVHQLFIPGRDGSPADWAFDTLGVAAGLYSGRRLMASAVARWLR